MPLSRPSKKWFYTCVDTVNATDPKKACGKIWTRISPAKRKRIRRNKEAFSKKH